MAGKRTASTDLNADNWNEEDEPEDAGTFQKAPDDVLTRRVVKTARRRLPASGESSTKSAFGGFGGFKTTAPSTSSPFSFLAKPKSDNSTITSSSINLGSSKTPTTNGLTKISENGLGVSASTSASSTQVSRDLKTKSVTTEKECTSPKKAPEYYAKLKGLNQSVAQWIKTHVDANPVCILTPIFRDYEKYLKDIEMKHSSDLGNQKVPGTKQDPKIESKPAGIIQSVISTSKKQDNFMFSGSTSKISKGETSDGWKPEKSIFSSASPATKSIFSSTDKPESKSPFIATSTIVGDNNPFLTKKPTIDSEKDAESNKPESKSASGPTSVTFSQSTSSLNPSAPAFSFGQNSTSPVSAGFSFGGGKPFTFGTTAVKPVETDEKPTSNDDKEDEDDEPPKPDFKPVTEEGSIYEQRCKVFVKKDNNYSDKGVGTLFLKPAPNDKMQLIVRAVNSLGNLLLNTLLTDSIPIKRLNKTNIMLVCLPLPTAEPPPVATLLRVKTPEEADALFEALQKHKK